MTIKDVNTLEEFKNVTSDNCLTVIKYSAKWCGPCRRLEPVFKDFAKSNKEINFVHIDVDAAMENLPTQIMSVMSVPTFHFYKEGKIVDKLEGGNVNSLRDKIEKLKGKKLDDGKNGTGEKSDKKDASQSKVIEVSSANKFMPLTFGAKKTGKLIKPLYEQWASEYSDINFLKVDVDNVDNDLDQIIGNLEIAVIPTFLFYLDGKIVERLAGGNPQVLKKTIDKLASVKSNSDSKKKDKDKNKNKNENEKKTSPNNINADNDTKSKNSEEKEKSSQPYFIKSKEIETQTVKEHLFKETREIETQTENEIKHDEDIIARNTIESETQTDDLIESDNELIKKHDSQTQTSRKNSLKNEE